MIFCCQYAAGYNAAIHGWHRLANPWPFLMFRDRELWDSGHYDATQDMLPRPSHPRLEPEVTGA